MNTYNGSCHTNSSPLTVTVNPTPTANIGYTGTGYFCQGSSVVLPANTGVGLSYQWYTNSSPVNGATSSTYTTSSSGTYSVVVSNTYGCSATSSTVTLIAAPPPPATVTVSGSTTICNGNSAILIAPAGSNLTYQWDSAGIPINGATNSTYAATTSGAYTVTVTNLNGQGCSTVSAPVTITVNNNPLPVAAITYNGNAVICFGDSLKLNASTGTGYSYKWIVNTNIINGATSSSYTAHNSGNYEVIITDNNGCIGTSSLVSVSADTPINPVVTRAGNQLTANSGYTSYQWYNNGNAIVGATGATYNTNGTPGTYTVKVTDALGCAGISNSTTIVGVNNLSPVNNDIRIYPNPATTFVYIESANKVNVSISSVQGQVIIHKDDADKIDLKGLANGVYFIQVYDENNILLKAERFIKNSQ